jgi:hypothetical protein
MRIPPPPERIKEAPAHALRAVFAGVGQVLLMTERIRQRAAEQVHPRAVPAPPPVPVPAPPPVPAPAPGRAPAPARAQAPAPAPPRAPAPEAEVVPPSPAGSAEAAASRAAEPETAPPEAPARERAAADLPVPGYDELSVASLRSRLRTLDAAQVRELLDYERAHASRANVVTMFERRTAKLEGPEDADTTPG